MGRQIEYTQKRQTIPFYRNWLLSAAMLPDADLGMLLKTCIGYMESGRVPEEITKSDNIAIRMTFENFRVADDVNYKKFIARCQQNKRNRNAYKDEPESDDI